MLYVKVGWLGDSFLCNLRRPKMTPMKWTPCEYLNINHNKYIYLQRRIPDRRDFIFNFMSNLPFHLYDSEDVCFPFTLVPQVNRYFVLHTKLNIQTLLHFNKRGFYNLHKFTYMWTILKMYFLFWGFIFSPLIKIVFLFWRPKSHCHSQKTGSFLESLIKL